MKKVILVVACLVIMGMCQGCLSLSRSEREDLRMLKEYDLPLSDHNVKSPILAATMNVLPGMGNIYLAINTDESAMWTGAAIGIVSWVVWPLSAIIAIPEGAIDAVTINRREAIYYYMRTDRGRAELQAAIGRMKAMPPIRP